MRAAIYVRLSELTDATTSPARQREDCLKVVEANGWDLAGVFEDLDVSAYTGVDRPGWRALMAALPSIDVLVCWKLDRLYRRFTGFVRLLEELERADVRLVSVNDTLDTTTPMGQAIAGFLAAQAETESRNAGVRIRSAQQHLAQAGKWRGGKVPYGWRRAPHPDGGWQLVLDPVASAVLLEVVDMLERGISGRGVADRLNRRGVPSWSGRPWSGQQIYKMVRSPRMVGWQPAGGDVVRDADGIPVPGGEALLGVDRWQRLVARLRGVGWDRTRRSGATMLSGLVRCGLCGGPMAGWTGDHPRASYACSRRADHGQSVCQGPSIKRTWVDEYVSRLVIRKVEAHRPLPDPDPAPAAADPVAPLVAQLRRLERDRTELGLYDDPESEQVYVSRWRQLRQQIHEARQASEAAARRDVRPDRALVTPDDIRRRWGQLDDDQRRTIVRAWIERVEIGPVRAGHRGQWDPERVRVAWLV